MRQVVRVALTVLLCAPAYAVEDPVEPSTLSVGSRIRITSSSYDEPVVGTLVSVEGADLVVRRTGSDTATRFPVAGIRSLEVSSGRRSHAGRGATIGGAVGAMPGLLLSFGDYSSDVHGDSNAGTVAAIGAASGALLGAAIGLAVKSERWVAAEAPRAALAAVPVRGGIAVSLTVAWGGSAR